MIKIGYYSVTQDREHGHSFWEDPIGKRLQVTEVGEPGCEPSQYNDFVRLGPVVKVVELNKRTVMSRWAYEYACKMETKRRNTCQKKQQDKST